MNHQEVFSKVAGHLLKQKKKAQRPGRLLGDLKCAYKDFSGNQCAIGCLLPPGHDAEEFMGDVNDLFDAFPDLKASLGVNSDLDTNLLMTLQNIHDNYHVNDWRDQLTILAAENGWSCEAFKDL